MGLPWPSHPLPRAGPPPLPLPYTRSRHEGKEHTIPSRKRRTPPGRLSSLFLSPDFYPACRSSKRCARRESYLHQYVSCWWPSDLEYLLPQSRLDQRFGIHCQHRMCVKPTGCCTCATRWSATRIEHDPKVGDEYDYVIHVLAER
jgi:hypothetical protein